MRRLYACAVTCTCLLTTVLFVNLISLQGLAQTNKSISVSSSSIEDELVRELNLARTKPQEYVAFLEGVKRYYVGKQLQLPGRPAETTIEGVSALDDAISFLRAAKPLPPFNAAKGLSSAATDHVKGSLLAGHTGHKGLDGSSTEDRVGRYGEWSNAIGESIAYHTGTAREIVIAWIIDDGSANRGHRKNIFNPNHNIIGMAFGDNEKLGKVCVTTFAGSFSERAATSAGEKSKPVIRKF